ncbi:MAG: glutamate--tRNA ligase [Patescibacteria group bacterium]
MPPKEGKKVKLRFAPSPTGPLNIGGVRTALFNWLFARHEGGLFVLRIEDTDTQRSEARYEEDIKKSLEWLGLSWDELYRQSDRLERYRFYLEQLLEKKYAYYCFCTEKELEDEYQAQLSQGMAPKYSKKCLSLSDEEVKKRLEKESGVIRFRVPEKEISFHDLVRGKVTFDTRLIGDIIIAKGLDEPLYNFANVVDDFEMNITHVVRGEEHISNTPRQIALQEALGFSPLVYAHLPLILGSNKKKLSKRDLAKSIYDYKIEGYLPEAMINFLVLLGWHPKKDREILSIQEMIEEFSFERVQKAGGIFNPEKLDWLNAHYIRSKSNDELVDALDIFIPEQWKKDKERIRKVIKVERERIKRLGEFVSLAGFFFELQDYEKTLLVWKKSNEKEMLENLKLIQNALIPHEDFSHTSLENLIYPIAELRGRGDVLWPLRAALSGKSASPGPFELLEILGKKESLERISVAIAKLSS